MAKTYGDDLRGRVMAAVDGGMSRTAAVTRFKVARRRQLPGCGPGATRVGPAPSPKAATPARTGSRHLPV